MCHVRRNMPDALRRNGVRRGRKRAAAPAAEQPPGIAAQHPQAGVIDLQRLTI
jgi:hypothetical protein